MSRMDEIRAIFAKADAVMGETISYNGTTIYATPEIGATLDKNTGIDAAVLADLAVFTVSETDVPTPKAGDVIVHNGKTYKMNRIQSYDSMAGRFVLDCVANTRGLKR